MTTLRTHSIGKPVRIRLARGMAVLALAVFAAAGASVAAEKKKAAKVVVETVHTQMMSQTMPVIGRIVPHQAGLVAALTKGPVQEVVVKIGDRVKKGDVIARMVPDWHRVTRDLQLAELREKKAALGTARAQLKLTEGELRRLSDLRKSAAFSQARYDDKQNEVAKVKSQVSEAAGTVARAKATLRQAQIDLRNTVIYAPYNGVVLIRNTVAGAYLDVGAPVVAMYNDDEVEIEADVPSDRLSGLTAGREVGVQLADGRKFRATVRTVVPSENAMTRTQPVRLVPIIEGISREEARRAANQSVTVMVPIAEGREVLTVSKDAVIAKNGRKFVVVVEDGKARRRSVELGDAVGGRFVVRHGLKAGDLAIIRGNERLRPDQAVRHEMAKPEPTG